MRKKESSTLPRDLCFPEEVRASCGFLRGHGYECVSSDPYVVRFESTRSYVLLRHGIHSFELGLEFGSCDSNQPEAKPYSMSELVRLLEPTVADTYRDFTADSTERVALGVQELALRFRRYVESGALDSKDVFERLLENREKWSRECAQVVGLMQSRRKLQGAWHAKRYSDVVALLLPFEDALSPSEREELAYAQRQLKKW